MIAELSRRLGLSLAPLRLKLSDGRAVQVDGVSESPFVLCEAWAHQGPPRGGQFMKLMSDALKMLYVERTMQQEARKILLFCDRDAALPFQGGRWQAQALCSFQIEVGVVELPETIRDRIAHAQARQYR
jgi:hypothetical protein